MTQRQAKELKALAKSHKVLNDKKLQHQIDNLEWMAQWYEAKVRESTDGWARAAEYIAALNYAMDVIKMYRKLTARLVEIAGEGDDDVN